MHARHGATIAAITALAAILLGASVALAKGGATVALTDPIPRDADPGSTLTVEFTVMVPGENGPTPMIGSPVFVRLIAPDGAATEGFGTEDGRRSGTYRAEVVVPAGGIYAAEFGLRGRATYADGRSERSDMLFEVNGWLFTTLNAHTATSPGSTGAAAALDVRPAIAIGLGGLLLAGIVLATRRRRLARVSAR